MSARVFRGRSLPWMFVCVTLVLPFSATAQWNDNTLAGTKINAGVSLGWMNVAQVSDSMINVVWCGPERSVPVEYHAQRLSLQGNKLWNPADVQLTVSCDVPDMRFHYDAHVSKSGKMLLVWNNTKHDPVPSVRADCFNADGSRAWNAPIDLDTLHGMPAAQGSEIHIIPSDSTHWIITWNDSTGTFAAKIDSAGNNAWGAPVCLIAIPTIEHASCATPDGGAAAFSILHERRNGQDLYFRSHQIVDANGVLLFPVKQAVNLYPLKLSQPRVFSAKGGFYISWLEEATTTLIWCQRFDSQYQVWSTAVRLSGPVADPKSVDVTVLTNGRLCAAWTEDGHTADSTEDVFLLTVTPNGSYPWGLVPLNVTAIAGDQTAPTLAADTNGGVFVVWEDRRNGVESDIYARYVRSDGVAQWITGGMPVSTAPGVQESPIAIAPAGIGVLVAWTDRRPLHPGFYASLIRSDGTPFPVEFLAFEGGMREAGVLLRWSTTNEINCAGYVIERRIGQQPAWTEIAFTPARRDGDGDGDYRYHDAQLGAFRPGERLFYRIRGFDYDGTYSESPVVEVQYSPIPRQAGIHIFPQPARGRVNIRWEHEAAAVVSLDITDALGRRIWNISTKGNTDTVTWDLRHADGRDVSPGIYFLRVRHEGGIIYGRIVVGH